MWRAVKGKEPRGAGAVSTQALDDLKEITQQLDFWVEMGPQQAGREHAGRQRRDTQEAGRQQLDWQEEVGAQQEETGTQQVGLHTGRQRRDTEEEGLQQEVVQQAGWQLDCWQHREEALPGSVPRDWLREQLLPGLRQNSRDSQWGRECSA